LMSLFSIMNSYKCTQGWVPRFSVHSWSGYSP
jgi:hypothetical protein